MAKAISKAIVDSVKKSYKENSTLSAKELGSLCGRISAPTVKKILAGGYDNLEVSDNGYFIFPPVTSETVSKFKQIEKESDGLSCLEKSTKLNVSTTTYNELIRGKNGAYRKLFTDEDASENPCELVAEDSYRNLIESIMYQVDRLAEFEGKSASSCSRGYSEIARAYMSKTPRDGKIKFDAGELDLFELAKLQGDGYISSFACYIDHTEIELTVECHKRLNRIFSIKSLLASLK